MAFSGLESEIYATPDVARGKKAVTQVRLQGEAWKAEGATGEVRFSRRMSQDGGLHRRGSQRV